jgi:hypothetical protein
LPTAWLEAAQNAGFATFDGTSWIFLSDAMREKLEQFAIEITKSIEQQTTERCIAACENVVERQTNLYSDTVGRQCVEEILRGVK